MTDEDTLLFERAALNAVPAARVAHDGPFVVRAFLGGTGRANAACSLDPAPDPGLAARLARMEAAYAACGLPARLRSTPLDPPGLESALRARGYAEEEGAAILAGPLSRLAADGAGVEVLDHPSEAWLGVLGTAEYQTAARREEKRLAAGMFLRPAAWALLAEEGVPAACGSAVADGPLLGIFDVATQPGFRGRGLARRVMAGLAAWGAARGAETAWLQVSPSNAGALRLYRGMGLAERYRYRYFVRR